MNVDDDSNNILMRGIVALFASDVSYLWRRRRLQTNQLEDRLALESQFVIPLKTHLSSFPAALHLGLPFMAVLSPIRAMAHPNDIQA